MVGESSAAATWLAAGDAGRRLADKRAAARVTQAAAVAVGPVGNRAKVGHQGGGGGMSSGEVGTRGRH